MKRALLFLALVALAACREELAEAPPPSPMTDEALSFFCQMNISEHAGPKGQIHLKGMPGPIFFAQVRDLVAYLKSPERDAEITAIYVSDMGAAQNWREVGHENWISAESAHFVIDAGVAGGMGAPEIVPFANAGAAQDFAARYGGSIVALSAIPDAAALAPVDLDTPLEDPA
ncbi:nitrous oxide reductase accessory protein NosL [Sedimentitalea nanhaiensis]|uniref:Copper chaperone NosL n=1 Tax=Sedimentitalea nanhaiensis TaxID=999627 RepID=A0A1I7E887_9RHOB|nr:nitrous oxide reductase accessory protein NosL [Sedimentitalea nanhaiensis]SFU20186.1 copper chaperone NosL [Sedimentitalea nanhaiensis]